MKLVERFREWRVDRLTNRMARRPHGRRVLEPAQGRVAIMTKAPEAKGTPAAPYPLATRGRFYADDKLVRLPLEAGFSSARIAHREPWAQLLVAHP